MALSVAKQVNACVQRALARIRLAFRAKLTALDTAPRVSLAQAEGLSKEQLQALELFQHYGFTSAPPAGTMCVILPLGGQTAHGVVVATEHSAYRIQGLQGGEVAIYTDEDRSADGCRIVLKRGNRIEIQARDIDVRAENLLHLSGREVEIHADERLETDVFGYGEAVNHGPGGYTLDSYHTGAAPLTSTEHGIKPEETP